MAALIGPAQVASRIGEIMMGRQIRPCNSASLPSGCCPWPSRSSRAGFQLAAALVFALLYGASNGLVTIAKGAVPLALFGPRGYGEVLGMISAPNLILNAAAPLLFALLLGWLSARDGTAGGGGGSPPLDARHGMLARLHRRASPTSV